MFDQEAISAVRRDSATLGGGNGPQAADVLVPRDASLPPGWGGRVQRSTVLVASWGVWVAQWSR